MANAQAKTQRRFQGTVVSAAQDKTIVVRIDRLKFHPMYKKRYTTSQRYQVHDERKQYQVGDVVEFVACRPLSKHKKWRVLYQS